MSVPSTAAASRTGRSTALTGLVWLLLAGALVRSVWLVLDSSIDLDVYRLGGMAVVDRHGFDDELYGSGLSLHGDGGLPFTYPPFAALLFVPPAYLPERLTELALGLASMGVAVVLSAVLLRYAAARGRPLPLPLPLQSLLGPLTAVAAGTAVLLWSGPWMRSVGLGQISALLVAPVLHDLLRGQLRPILTAGLTFAATVLIGFLALPRDAVVLRTDAVLSDDRVGDLAYVDNTSLQGVLLHLGVPGEAEPLLCWALVLVIVVGVALLIRVLAARRTILSVVAVNALVMLYLSPVTWSHHHVWRGPVFTALWVEAWPAFLRDGPRRLALLLGGTALVGLYVGPIRWDAWPGPLGASGPAIDVVVGTGCLALFLVLALWVGAGLRNGTGENGGTARG